MLTVRVHPERGTLHIVAPVCKEVLSLVFQMVQVETIITGVVDRWKFLATSWKRRMATVTCLCYIMFFIALPMCTQVVLKLPPLVNNSPVSPVFVSRLAEFCMWLCCDSLEQVFLLFFFWSFYFLLHSSASISYINFSSIFLKLPCFAFLLRLFPAKNLSLIRIHVHVHVLLLCSTFNVHSVKWSCTERGQNWAVFWKL